MARMILWLALMLQYLNCYHFNSIEAAAAVEYGCLAEMFLTAGISAQNAVQYENSFANLQVPASNVLNPVSEVLLRVAGIDSAEDRLAVKSCFGDSPKWLKSSACQTFSSCSSNGVCSLQSDQYRCQCSTGYHGKRCDFDPCQEMPCHNGGTCAPRTDAPHFTCQCPEGFNGSTCSLQIDHCASGPCQNGASCENMGAYLTCRCPVGYRGAMCEEKWLIKEYFDNFFARILATTSYVTSATTTSPVASTSPTNTTTSDVTSATTTSPVATTSVTTTSPVSTTSPTITTTVRQPTFRIYDEFATWDGAAQRCNEEGGTLASVRISNEVDDIVATHASPPHGGYWLGGEDKDRDGVYRWVGGDVVTVDNWGVDEPNRAGGEEDCMVVSPTGLWNDIPCDYVLYFVCEF